MRHSGRTDIEEAAAKALDKLGERYQEQVPMGSFIVDFYLPDKKTVVEADGVYWHSTEEARDRDRRKEKYLSARGIRLIRLPGPLLREAPVSALFNKLYG
jgi:very-short-patch-repair endonuclease